MKQQVFESRHAEEWRTFDSMLAALDDRKNKEKPAANDFVARYRRLCQQLALARDRHYAPALVDYLNRLALRGHHQLYSDRSPIMPCVMAFIDGGFPALVRKHGKLFLLLSLLFYGSFGGVIALLHFFPDLIYSFMDYGQVMQLEAMYDPNADRIGRNRDAGDDVYMFGFYIYNNIGIGFRSFAGGMLFGVGSLGITLFNGVYIGAVFGHLINVGYTETLFGFVVAHGAFELTAIVLAAVAGMLLGLALLKPGRHQRSYALRLAAGDAIQMMLGAAGFLLIAAFIEAFWSSQTDWPFELKIGVGAFCWILVFGYLAFSGKQRA